MIGTLSARLNLNANQVLQGGNIDLFRSSNDTWPENAINFGNQPGWTGDRLDTLYITSLGLKSFELLRLSNWEPWVDIADGKVTLVIKTPELSRMDGVRFDSREGFVKPSLVLTTRGRGQILNSDFENGSVGFDTAGTVTIVEDPDDPSNHLARLETASQSSIWQTIDTPNTLFGIQFDSMFLAPTGTFTLSLGGQVLLQVSAPQEPPGGVAVSDRTLCNRDDLDLKFSLDGPDGVTCQLTLDNIEIIEIPDPPLVIETGETSDSVTLSFYAGQGACYQIQRSPDAISWSDHGRPIGGLALTYEESIPLSPTAEFFRLRIIPHCEPNDIEPENWGFEEPVLSDSAYTTDVPGWTSTGGAGVWNPPGSVYPASAFDEQNVAYVHNGYSLSQTLGPVLEPYRVYTLDALVGKRPDLGFPNFSPPNLILRAGGVVLVPDEMESPEPTAGTFELWVRKFRIGKDHPQLGQPLEIVLDGGASSVISQVNFDSVLLGIE